MPEKIGFPRWTGRDVFRMRKNAPFSEEYLVGACERFVQQRVQARVSEFACLLPDDSTLRVDHEIRREGLDGGEIAEIGILVESDHARAGTRFQVLFHLLFRLADIDRQHWNSRPGQTIDRRLVRAAMRTP